MKVSTEIRPGNQIKNGAQMSTVGSLPFVPQNVSLPQILPLPVILINNDATAAYFWEIKEHEEPSKIIKRMLTEKHGN